ncbi:thiamine pyrophosphokinase [Devosia enhydra]|uniref:Thiamine diphosphokinase n=1 Tax=Devosia enhydra TaxID=665118 RepID=A0A1K2HTZ6_9HYPH|nr:thiamine diphosphokinase [Devosia enhydra]SFZ80885.1 thiamine pyrophosphokinase [Devosia enhydra]
MTEARQIELEYSGLLVVVGAGDVDLALLDELRAAGGKIVAADGGADILEGAGIAPEAIIGDFDSVADPFGWLGRSRLIKIAEQDTTDFEKVLYSTRAPVTVALGMTGGRLDHTLAALDVAGRYAAERFIIIVDAEDLALALSGPFGHEVAPGERVSVHPLGPIRFRRSTGLKYALNGLQLAPVGRGGTSNSATKGAFTVVPEEDETAPWLLILPRRYLMGLIERLLVLA